MHCSLKESYTIYSDAYDAVYWFTGDPEEFLPAREYKPGVKEFLERPSLLYGLVQ